jgi:hypothetical protein
LAERTAFSPRACAGEGTGALLLVEDGAEVLVTTAIACAVEDRVDDLRGERANRAVLTAS